MASVEDRIVRMEFDNAAFERRLESTIRSLGTLNRSLTFPSAGKGLTDVSNAVGRFHMQPMTTAIEGVNAKFLAMSTIAVTALSTIVSKAISAGADIVKALAFDNITQGFAEYELQIGSIQTILANTAREGTTLDQVNAALDQLNTYSDKTIYNFAQMSRNIGTFTAAGVDLETSVTSIQGIANLAAISGSTSEQASTAMYQLSQAISTGSLRLMDWNSVVNAGMGGEVFQRALFDTGVAMGTIVDTPMGTTFDEWTAAGNTFRGSLEEGWLTADVLTNTLQTFSGEMTEAQLTAIGFTQEQAAEMLKLGEIGVDAATKVRTLSQLMTTVKESLSSGWSQSFRLIFGDFEEATQLFTGISTAVGNFVSNSADARNEVLQGWRDLGGRFKLIEALRTAFKNLAAIMNPIKLAFRSIFPAVTAERLDELTQGFQRLANRMKPSGETVQNLFRIFRGFFNGLKLGWAILKEGIGFVTRFVQSISDVGSGGVLSGLAKIGDIFTRLKENLVDGGGLSSFFAGLSEDVNGLVEKLRDLGERFKNFLSGLRLPTGIGDIFERIGDAFANIRENAGDIGDLWTPLKDGLSGVAEILDQAWETLKGWFSSLGSRLGDAFGSDSFGSVLDTIDTGLLGGIAVLLAKFLSGGINFDFGGGFFRNISDSFEQLTGVLGAMQTNLKAEALLKIAGAVGILAVSLALLASIDAEAMSDALAAMALGFAQLLGAFALLNKMDIGVRSAASMSLIATGMVIMAGAILVLSAAVKIFSTMSWDELVKGLTGVGVALGLLTGAAVILSKFTNGLIRVGLGMMAIAVALGIMAGVVKLFSMMEWSEIVRGLVGVGGALAAIALGMRLMPKGMLAQGAGLLLIGTALNIIFFAVKQFAGMDWEEMGKGLVGVTGALLGIGIAVRLMPATLPLIGVGLLLVSGSLLILAEVMKRISDLSWGEIAKGLIGIAGALTALVLAMVIAQGGIAGAAALTVMVFAVSMLADVLQQVGNLSWSEIIKGLVGIAAAIGVLALASVLLAPVLPLMAGLGGVLLLVGAGFALFGLGVAAVAKGFEIIARVGKKGVEALVQLMKGVGENLPEFLKNVATALLELVQTILDGLPAIIDGLGVVVSKILDVLIDLIPKAAEAVRLLVAELLKTLRSLFPDLVATGFEMILALLQGIRDNIGEIVTVVAEIITSFLDALALKIPDLIDSMYNFIVAVVEGVVEKLVDIGSLLVPKGLDLINGLLKGLDDNKEKIFTFFTELPGKILTAIGDLLSFLVGKGGELLTGLYNGASSFFTETVVPWLAGLPGSIFGFIGDTLSTLASRGSDLISGLFSAASGFFTETVVPWLVALPGNVWSWIGDTLSSLSSRGHDLIAGLYNAVIAFMNSDAIPWFKALPGKIFGWVGNTIGTLTSRGRNLIIGFYNAVINYMNSDVIPWFKALPSKILGWIGDLSETLAYRGKRLMAGLYNGIIRFVNEDLIPWLSALDDKILGWVGDLSGVLIEAGKAVINGLWQGMQDVWDDVTGWLGGLADVIPDWKGPPEKDAVILYDNGKLILQGLQRGMEDEWGLVTRWMSGLDPADHMRNDLAAKVSAVLAGMADQLYDMEEFYPTITPVLDLTQVQIGARNLAGMLQTNGAYLQAARIAQASAPVGTSTNAEQTQVGGVKFEQNIYSPKALTTSDIYRNTKNQISLAKEELSIP